MLTKEDIKDMKFYKSIIAYDQLSSAYTLGDKIYVDHIYTNKGEWIYAEILQIDLNDYLDNKLDFTSFYKNALNIYKVTFQKNIDPKIKKIHISELKGFLPKKKQYFDY